jgi:hypothetical protein
MNTITYLKEVPLTKRIFGYVISLSGIWILLFNNIFFGAIFLAIGLNLILTEGSQINLDNKTCRTIKSIFGIHFGKWQVCPKFEYISVFKTTENQTINVISATTTITSDTILLNLFYDKNKKYTFYKTDNKETAFKVANHFKLALDIDILDATEKEKKWL